MLSGTTTLSFQTTEASILTVTRSWERGRLALDRVAKPHISRRCEGETPSLPDYFHCDIVGLN